MATPPLLLAFTSECPTPRPTRMCPHLHPSVTTECQHVPLNVALPAPLPQSADTTTRERTVLIFGNEASANEVYFELQARCCLPVSPQLLVVGDE